MERLLYAAIVRYTQVYRLILVYSNPTCLGAMWWLELVLLVISEGFAYAVYIVGHVAMVEVVPTR